MKPGSRCSPAFVLLGRIFFFLLAFILRFFLVFIFRLRKQIFQNLFDKMRKRKEGDIYVSEYYK